MPAPDQLRALRLLLEDDEAAAATAVAEMTRSEAAFLRAVSDRLAFLCRVRLETADTDEFRAVVTPPPA